jgi:seryl-tRNA synthetase
MRAARACAARRALSFRPQLDYRFLREHADKVAEATRLRRAPGDALRVRELAERVRALQYECEQLARRRNEVADKIARAVDAEEKRRLVAEGRAARDQLTERQATLAAVETELEREALRLPNLIHPNTPIGSEERARVLAELGAPRAFDFEPADHVALGTALDLFDFEGASRVSGSNFAVLRNDAALLELALVQWAMAGFAARGYTPLLPPDLVRPLVSLCCGFQPREEDERKAQSQVYRVEGHDLCLAGTAEVPVAGLLAGQVIEHAQLPMRFVAFGHAFRTEAGAHGLATRGLYRLHQFSKVELFAFAAPEQSEAVFEQLLRDQLDMFGQLGLHLRALEMPSEELGAPAYRKVDVEAWMPGRKRFGEISSTSNCTDYQARRLAIRCTVPHASERVFAHTLNGTACAVPRTMLALLETHQRRDGSVELPPALRPFMGGRAEIAARAAPQPSP